MSIYDIHFKGNVSCIIMCALRAVTKLNITQCNIVRTDGNATTDVQGNCYKVVNGSTCNNLR